MTLSEHPNQPVLVGFDPGRQKCGVAVMALDRRLLMHEIISAGEAIATLQDIYQRFPVSMMIMGDQTTAQDWKKKLEENLNTDTRIVLIDERYTSLEARDRYWQMYPPRGLTQLLPKGMRTPPRPVDDIVAILLIERYLDRLTQPL
jgi:RNase H-fold protein (predicted Holliday junction resolvase)